jgi:lipopolysaccharide export LptBFGC system permease protein LptF
MQAQMEKRRDLDVLYAWAADQSALRSIGVRIHKRLAQALSVLSFVMVGIPLGILASRRSVILSLGLSFGLVLFVFYPFMVVGQMAAEVSTLSAAPLIWMGNAVMLAIGAVLMARVVRL